MTMDNHAARKAAVYEAALQLIARGVSPAAMTIQQLADAAGIGKGTVYEYFSSKEEILQGVARYCFAQENARVAERFARCSGGRSGLMIFTTTKPCRTQTSRSMTRHSGRAVCTALSTA